MKKITAFILTMIIALSATAGVVFADGGSSLDLPEIGVGGGSTSGDGTSSTDGEFEIDPQPFDGIPIDASALSVKLTKNTFVYNGKVQAPAFLISDKDGNAVDSSNYDVSMPKNSKEVGAYTAVVVFKNQYTGKVKRTYQIVPKGTSLNKPKAVSKGVNVSWKKQMKNTTGYQIQLATNSKFTKGVKTYKITKNKTTSKTIKKLKGKTKYFIRIRTYKAVGKKEYYSSWSKAKSVATKK